MSTFQEIVQVSATDKDSGENGNISYFLHTDASDNFTINNVKVNCPLDPASKSYAVKVPTIGSLS
jgi:hypothetical protein